MSNKRIIFHVTRKYMRLNRRRTLITFLGIMCMVMLMTCVFVGRDTVVNYLENTATLDKGNWHIIAYDLDADQAAKISGMDEIERAGFSVHLGYAELPQPTNPDTPYLEIKAYSADTFGMMNITLAEGRLPENEHEILISKAAIEDGADIKIGDSISSDLFAMTITGTDPKLSGTAFPFYGIELHYGETIETPIGFPFYGENASKSFRQGKAPNGRHGEYTVVGIMERPYFEKSVSAGYSSLTLISERDMNGGGVNAVMSLDLDKIDTAYGFTETLSSRLGTELDTKTNELLLAFSAKGKDSVTNYLTIFFEAFFTVLIIAASLILIYNVFNISYGERIKYLGMLSSVGATRKQKRWSIYYEMLYLLIPALPLGILLGFAVIGGGMTALKPHLGRLLEMVSSSVSTDIPIRLSVSAVNLMIVAIISLVTVMISAFIPAAKIAKIGPLESIRSSGISSKKRSKTKLGLLRRGKAEALLAVCSTSRCRYLTKGIIRSIAVLGTLAVVTLYGADAVIKIVGQKADEEDMSITVSGYDYYLSNHMQKDELYYETAARISESKAVNNVKAMDQIFLSVEISGDYFSDEYRRTFEELIDWYDPGAESKQMILENSFYHGEYINFIILDDEDYKDVASKGDVDMNIAENIAQPSIMLFDHKEMSTDLYRFSDKEVDYKYFEVNNVYCLEKGDDLALTIWNEAGAANCKVKLAGYVDNDALKGLYKLKGQRLYGVINESAAKLLDESYDSESRGHGLIEHNMMFSIDGESSEGQALLREISLICGESDNGLYLGRCDMLNGLGSIKQAISAIIKILSYCFTGLVSVICLLNLYNSIKGRAIERKKEIYILRSVGITDRQLGKMYGIENLMMLARGLAVSAVFSAAAIYFVGNVVHDRFGNITLPIPWTILILTAAVIGATSAVMTKLCHRSSGDDSILEEIRSETV